MLKLVRVHRGTIRRGSFYGGGVAAHAFDVIVLTDWILTANPQAVLAPTPTLASSPPAGQFNGFKLLDMQFKKSKGEGKIPLTYDDALPYVFDNPF